MFVVCEAATVPEDALLGRHLEPGAREYYSLRGSPEEAEERDRRYDDGTSCLGVYLKVHMCIYIYIFKLSLRKQWCELFVRFISCILDAVCLRPVGVLFRITLIATGLQWLQSTCHAQGDRSPSTTLLLGALHREPAPGTSCNRQSA